MFGNAQSTSSVVSSIDFSPIIQFGEEQNSAQDKVNHQTQEVSPKQDNGFTASVGVGVGGAGSGGAVARTTTEEDTQPKETYIPTTGTRLDKNFMYVGAGVLALGGLYYITKKKK